MRQPTRAAHAMLTDILVFLLAAATFGCVLLLPLRALAAEEAFTQEEMQLVEAYQAGDIIRLHVLADSDLPEAQRIKLCVRDAVLTAFGAQMATSCATADEAYGYLCQNGSAMQHIAREAARAQGFAGTVQAEVGVLTLPEKTYGRVTLPKGEYRALRITLGSGEGQNWWCVLFPQLCLAVSGDDATPVSTPVQTDALHWDCLRIVQHWLLWDEKCIYPESML